jgi:hypothetical protein
MTPSPQDFVAATIATPVHSAVSAMADQIRQKHENVLAILAYGSALRDAKPETTVIDFYVLTETLHGVSASAVSRLFCDLLPPNVYYAEAEMNGLTYRCKYAALPVDLAALKVSSTVANPYFWVRFAQPMRLVWCANDKTRRYVTDIIGASIETASANANRLAPQASVTGQWTALFENTYRTELRPEAASRARDIVESQKSYFEAISKLASPVRVSRQSWFNRRWQGKLLSIARLLKAAFTFQGGADYAAWKIKRHSGVDIKITDWHRRHPVLASIMLLPKLLRRGALK